MKDSRAYRFNVEVKNGIYNGGKNGDKHNHDALPNQRNT